MMKREIPTLILLVFIMAVPKSFAQSNTFPAAGNVGIGTYSPFEKLDVRGIVFLRNAQPDIVGEQLRIGRNDGDIRYHSIYSRHTGTASNNFLEFRIHSGGSGNYKSQVSAMVIKGDGNVGIGTASPDSKLAVNGTVKAKEVNVTATGWADYVFDEGYDLRSLEEVKVFYTRYGHLPNIPNEAEVKEYGIDLAEMSKKYLEKIEELTLYLVQQNERIKILEAQLGIRR